MALVIPDHRDLERMSWWQRDRARKAMRAHWPKTEDYQARIQIQPWQDPDHPDWADATRAEARRLLASMPVDPQAFLRHHTLSTVRVRPE